MCTALTYFDSSSRPYVGRTLEFPVLLPSQLGFVPAGTAFTSQVPGKEPVRWTARHGFVGAGTPGDVSKPGVPVAPSALLVYDGMNDAGLVVNANAYPDTGETPDSGGPGAVLEAADFGTWLLGNFATVAQARAALATQPVNATRLGILGDLPFPLHLMVTDATGQSVTIEGKGGTFHVFDNPVHVMTNGPRARTRYYVRDYTALNWSVVDMTRLAGVTELRLIPLASLDPLGADVTDHWAKGSA